MSEKEVNQKVAEEICSTSRLNGKVFRTGDCVGLLDGQVVIVAHDLKSAVDAVRVLDPNPLRGMVFEVKPLVPDLIR